MVELSFVSSRSIFPIIWYWRMVAQFQVFFPKEPPKSLIRFDMTEKSHGNTAVV